MQLGIASLNCRGLNKNIKRKRIFQKCKEFDIICLQETHITKDNGELWKTEWGGNLYFSEGTANSKGQIILINRKLDFDQINIVVKTERLLGISIKLKNETESFYIINVYGPNNDLEKPSFIDSLYAVHKDMDNQKTFFVGILILCCLINLILYQDCHTEKKLLINLKTGLRIASWLTLGE